MTNQQKISGKPPFGYTWQDGELVIVPEEAPIYAEIFDLYLVHQRKRSVARHLNEKGYRTRAGKKFAYSTVDRLLKNPIAKGLHRVRITHKNGEREWVENPVSPVVSEETWNHANEMMKTQAGKQTRKPAQDVFVGKIVCCEAQMEILPRSTNYFCHQCKSEIAIDDIHAIFTSTIEDIPFPAQELLNDLAGKELHNSQSAIKSKIAEFEVKIEKLYDLHSADAISAAVFKDRFELLDTQLSELKSNLEQAEKPRSSYETLYDYWLSIDAKTKHVFIDTVVHQISINANVASVSLYPLFNFDKLGTEKGV